MLEFQFIVRVYINEFIYSENNYAQHYTVHASINDIS